MLPLNIVETEGFHEALYFVGSAVNRVSFSSNGIEYLTKTKQP